MSPETVPYLLLAFVLGLALGYVLILKRGRELVVSQNRERELENKNAILETENLRITSLEEQKASLTDNLLAAQNQLGEFRTEARRVPILETTLDGAKVTNDNLSNEVTRLTTELKNEQENATEKLRIMREDREELLSKFDTLSKKALQESNQSFLTLAEQKLGKYQKTAESDLEARRLAIIELLKPLERTLGELDKSNREMERLRTDAYATLMQQVQHLSQSDELSRQQVTKLISTLDAPKPRGDWGEEQLRRIVELAGMTEYCNFDVQVHLKGDSTFRANMIIRLAGGKSIIVDAKAPWDREVFQSDDSKERNLKISVMCSNFRKHIDDLWKRDYSALVPDSPDFVVMFVPIEPVFHLVLQTDPSLIAYAIGKKVVLASPTTLIAMLKSVAFGWQQDAISQNAQKISSLGKDLYDRFGVFGKHLSNVGKHLNDSVKSYNDLLNSTESRLLVTARRFNKEFKISSDSEIPESRPIETIAAFASAPELQQEFLPAAGPPGSIFESLASE